MTRQVLRKNPSPLAPAQVPPTRPVPSPGALAAAHPATTTAPAYPSPPLPSLAIPDWGTVARKYGKEIRLFLDGHRDRDALRRRLEENRRRLQDPTLDPLQTALLGSALRADTAMLVALQLLEQEAALRRLEASLDPLRALPPEEQQKELHKLLGLGLHYLELGAAPLANPADAAFVRERLSALAGLCFGILGRFAEGSVSPELRKLAPLYHGYRALAEGRVAEGLQIFEAHRGEIPEIDALLRVQEERTLRDLNLAALEVWELYNAEGEAMQRGDTEGWIGTAFGAVDHLLRKDGKTLLHDQAEKWKLERELTLEAKRRLQRGEAWTVLEALELVRRECPRPELRDRAAHFLDLKNQIVKGRPLHQLFRYVAQVPPDAEAEGLLLHAAFELECADQAAQTPAAVYQLVRGLSADPNHLAQAQEHLDAWQGRSSFVRAAQKIAYSASPEGLAVDVGLMFASAGLGALAKLSAARKLEALGVGGVRAMTLAAGAGLGAETTALWAGNNVKSAAFQDPAKVFSPEHLAKSYGATFCMIGLTKAFGALGKGAAGAGIQALGIAAEGQLTLGGRFLAGSIGHASGLGGMIAATRVNEGLGFQETPVGGAQESLAHDLLGYFQFALAHRLADGATGQRMSKLSARWERETGLLLEKLFPPSGADAPQTKHFRPSAPGRLFLRNPLTWMFLGIEGGGAPGKAKPPPAAPGFRKALAEAARASELGAERRIILARAIQKELEQEYPLAREEGLRALERLLPGLPTDAVLSVALTVERHLFCGREEGEAAARAVLEKSLPYLAPADRLRLFLEMERRLATQGRGAWMIQSSAEEFLSDHFEALEEPDRWTFAQGVAERSLSAGGDAETYYATLLENLQRGLSFSRRLSLVTGIERRLEDPDETLRGRARDLLKSLVGRLRPHDRMEYLERLFDKHGTETPPMGLLAPLLSGIAPEVLAGYARSRGRADLALLSEYHRCHLPWDAYFWRAYLASKNPGKFLQKTSVELAAARRGKRLRNPGEAELHLAYGGLDSPDRLPFEEFRAQFDPKLPPPPFLKAAFRARVPLVRSVHEKIDKGKISQALQPIESVREPELFKDRLLRAIQKERGALKPIQQDLQAAFPEGLEPVRHEQLVAAARFLLPRLWQRSHIPPIHELAAHFALFLAWHQPGLEGLKAAMGELRAKQVPSESLGRGLRATEEFYRDALEDALSPLGLSGDALPFFKKHRRLLAAELDRIRAQDGDSVELEFLPSKNQADRFFGWVGEDCNKHKGALLDRRDFQLYRIVTSGRLAGLIYLQSATLDGKRVLVLAIQPRPHFAGEPAGLLRAIEENFSAIAAREGFDAVLLAASPGQQSNRQDMLKAIADRGYPGLSFSRPILGTVFSGRDFLQVWARDPWASSK